MLQGAGGGDPMEALKKQIPQAELSKLSTGDPSIKTDAAPNISPSISTGFPQSGGTSFESTLGSFVNDVNGKQAAAADSVNGLLGGQNVSLHQAMIKMEEANISFQLMVEVRNKLLESYQELMRMQI
ncbi:MAG: fliE [Verrucomicrobiales bacterium]|nr:fliE [Verrucomicrobiales bacterium]MDB6131148.1 fliE [Verrucomicrobiales bacterium]